MKPASSLTGQQMPLFSHAVAIVLAYDVQALLTKLLGGLLPPELPLATKARCSISPVGLAIGHLTWPLPVLLSASWGLIGTLL